MTSPRLQKARSAIEEYFDAAPRNVYSESNLAGVLDEMRAAVAGRRTILSAFSFADIAASQILQFVAPVTSKSFRIGRATRRVFGAEELAREYADVIAWRDELYATAR